MMKVFLHNLRQSLIAFDQLMNCLLGAFLFMGERAWADETFSSRCHRWDISGKRHWPKRVVDFLAAILGDSDHCKESYESERLGRQLPAELRK